MISTSAVCFAFLLLDESNAGVPRFLESALAPEAADFGGRPLFLGAGVVMVDGGGGVGDLGGLPRFLGTGVFAG